MMLGEIADGIVRTADDAAPPEFLRYRGVHHEQLRRCQVSQISQKIT